MPSKGQKYQRVNDEPLDSSAPSSAEPLLAAFDVNRDDLLQLVFIKVGADTLSADMGKLLAGAMSENGQPLLEKLRESVPNPERCLVVASDLAYPRIKALEDDGFSIRVPDRALALYWAYKAPSNRPCLVLSTNEDQSSCSLVVNGTVKKNEDSVELSASAIWHSYLAAQPDLARAIEFRSRKDPGFLRAIREAFISVWKNGNTDGIDHPVAKYFLSNSVDVSSSLAAFRQLLSDTDPNGTAGLVLLADLAAAYCNLDALLPPQFEVIGAENPSRAFNRAFEGLIRIGLYEVALRERPQLKLNRKEIAFGKVRRGKTGRTSFDIQNVGGGTLQAELIGEPWLRFEPRTIACEKTAHVTVEAQAASLPDGPTQAQFEVRWFDNTGPKSEQVSVSIEIVPRPFVDKATKILTKEVAQLPPELPISEAKAAGPVRNSETAAAADAAATPSKGKEVVVVSRPTPLSTQRLLARFAYVTLGLGALALLVIFLIVLIGPIRKPANGNVNGQQPVAQNVNLSPRGPLVSSTQPPGFAASPTPVARATPITQGPVTGPPVAQATPGDQSTPFPVVQPTLSSAEVARAHYLRARDLYEGMKYPEAIAECDAGLTVDPNNEPLRNLRANIQRAKQRLDDPGGLPVNRDANDGGASHQVSAQLELPAITSQSPVVYPPAAKAAGVTGAVVVKVSLDDRGVIIAAIAVSGPLPLRAAAVDAARRSKYRPARQGGQPVASTMTVTFNFSPH